MRSSSSTRNDSPNSIPTEDVSTTADSSPSNRHHPTLLRSSIPTSSSLRSSSAPIKSPKTEITPVSIRSGIALGSVAANLDAKKPSLFKFVPNIRPTTPSSASGPSSGLSTPVRRLKTESPTPSSNELDMSSMLAHSLSLKNMQQGGTRHLQELHLRRASAPGGGAFSGRNAGDRRAMSVQAKVQQHLHNIRRKKGGKKSMNVLELSWAEGPGGVPLYTPVTLPYVAIMENEEEDREDEPNNGVKINRGSKRPTSRHIDESNRHAASLFDDNNEDEFSDANHQWLFVQLPSVLPALDRNGPLTEETQSDNNSKLTSQSSSSARDDLYCATSLEGLPEGRLGTLQIHRSGKVTFVLGHHQFEVNQGTDCNFSQEVACLIGGSAELMFLGRCSKRIVVTPDLTQIAT